MYRLGQKAAVFDGGRVLILRQSGYNAFGAGRWDLPGGRVKEGEEPHAAILRELFEETGMTLTGGDGLVSPMYCHTETGEDWVIQVHPFHYDGHTIILSAEHIEFKWVRIDELDGVAFKHEGTASAVKKLYSDR